MPIAALFSIAFVIVGIISTVSVDAWAHARSIAHARKAGSAAQAELVALDRIRAAIGPQIDAGVAPGSVALPAAAGPVPLCAATPCETNVTFTFTDAGRSSAGTTSNPAETAPNVQTDPGVGEAYVDVMIGEAFTDARGVPTGAQRTVPLKLRLYRGAPYATPVGNSDVGQAALQAPGHATGCAGGACGADTRIHAYVQCDDATYVVCAQRWTETGGFSDHTYSSAARIAAPASK